MIRGRFDRNGAAFLKSAIYVPLLGGGLVDFLVDTGASHTALHPADAANLGIDLNSLTYGDSSQGIGGSARYSTHFGVVLLSDTDEDGNTVVRR